MRKWGFISSAIPKPVQNITRDKREAISFQFRAGRVRLASMKPSPKTLLAILYNDRFRRP